MYSICVKGKIIHTLTVTEGYVGISFELQNYSNVLFPTKHISVIFNLLQISNDLQHTLEFIERKMNKEIEINIQFPVINRLYYATYTQYEQ